MAHTEANTAGENAGNAVRYAGSTPLEIFLDAIATIDVGDGASKS